MQIIKKDKIGGGKELQIFNESKDYGEDNDNFDLVTLTTSQEPVEEWFLSVSWDSGEDEYTVTEIADTRKSVYKEEFKTEAKQNLTKFDRYLLSDFPSGDKPGTDQQILDYRTYLRGFISNINSESILVINVTTNEKEVGNRVQTFATWLAAQ